MRPLPKLLSKAEIKAAIDSRRTPPLGDMEKAVGMAMTMPAAAAARSAGVKEWRLRREMKQRGLVPLGPQKAPSCTQCGGPNETHGRCRKCERARERGSRRCNLYAWRKTPEGRAARQRERAKAAAKKGRTYRTAEQIEALRATKATQMMRSEHVWREVVLLRAFARAISRRWVSLARVEWGRPGRPCDKAMLARARYRFDPKYHAMQVLKRHMRDVATAAACDGTLTKRAIYKIFSRTKQCGYCGKAMSFGDKSLDHLVPISRGGAHSIENVEVVCLTCNKQKRCATALEFLMVRAA